jgi:peptidoglycan hydrolase-like protein with peptidoglycan-binding domain
MGTGFLEIVVTTATGSLPVTQASVIVSDGDIVLYQMTTDESGLTDTVPLETPPVAYTLDVNYTDAPYSVCDVRVEACGFMTTIIHGVEIFDTETSILPVNMLPALEDGQIQEIYIPTHKLVRPPEERFMEGPDESAMARILREVIIPSHITVHLGRPDRPARNIRVPFPYYIKNVCSNEIFATWPHASLEANIYCQISLALNRIFSEWYRVRGHNFDVTNSTQFDQVFVEGGQIFRNIDELVDQIFNRYIRRESHLEPFFAEYCDGRMVTCPGLWQWSTVALAQQGRDALQILRHFYPSNIQIVETNNIAWVQESFPGFALRPGMSGPDVRRIQLWLNRIRINFPAIPIINNVGGVFGPQTEVAVKAFQSIRELGMMTPNGIVDRNTWHQLSFTYFAVRRLGELTGEGIIIGIGRTPPTDIIREGARGRLVQTAQYLLNFIAEFYPSVPSVIQNSSYTRDMTNAVREFQRLFGLNADGIIGPITWRQLYTVYWRIRDNVTLPNLPTIPLSTSPPPYPGYLIRMGATGESVRQIQSCLNRVNSAGLKEDGIFGPLTQAAVINYQRANSLSFDGIVGPITWEHLMSRCYQSRIMREEIETTDCEESEMPCSPCNEEEIPCPQGETMQEETPTEYGEPEIHNWSDDLQDGCSCGGVPPDYGMPQIPPEWTEECDETDNQQSPQSPQSMNNMLICLLLSRMFRCKFQ